VTAPWIDTEFRAAVSLPVGYRYRLSYPSESAPAGGRWPLLVFLHGSGERGEDLDVLIRNGPPKLIAEGRTFPAIVASPLAPDHAVWDPHAVQALVDELRQRCSVDDDRVYLTGLSMGGYGVWDTLAAYPDTFAAAVPICGGGGATFIVAERFAHVPVWIFHGAEDPEVPVAEAQRMHDALLAAGGAPTLTLYPGVGHDAWTRTYADPALWAWLFAQRRNTAARR
jgi:predicted peptidase